MEHKTKLDYVTFEKLARDLADLRYDALAEFLEKLRIQIGSDGENDFDKDRRQLAAALKECYFDLGSAQEDIEEAWRISEPYMKD
jgi:hypothetical protein